MHTPRTTVALLTVALILLTPAVAALPTAGPGGASVPFDETATTRMCVSTSPTHQGVCTPYLAQAHLYGNVTTVAPGSIALGRQIATVTAGAELDAAGRHFQTGTVSVVIGPMPFPGPEPGPGPCGVGCIPPWVYAMRDWAVGTACNTSNACQVGGPTGGIVRYVLELLP